MPEPIEAANNNNNNKEVPLFSDKSVREEAYLNKILQLEKELVRLEKIAKVSDYPQQKKERVTERLQGYYSDSLTSFDKNVKKESDFLDRKANELTERLNLQAQRISFNIESNFQYKAKWIFLSALIMPLVMFILFIAAFFLLRNNAFSPYIVDKQQKSDFIDDSILDRRLSFIKGALQTQTRYHHLYNIDNLDRLEDIYIAEISMNSVPTNKLFLKDISSELTRVFKRYLYGSEAEFYFRYKDKLYMKAYLAASSPKVRLQYFSSGSENPA